MGDEKAVMSDGRAGRQMLPGACQMLPETTRCAGRLPDAARSYQMLWRAHQMLQEGARRWIFIDLLRFSLILETPGPECWAGLWRAVAPCGGLCRPVAASCGPFNKLILGSCSLQYRRISFSRMVDCRGWISGVCRMLLQGIGGWER